MDVARRSGRCSGSRWKPAHGFKLAAYLDDNLRHTILRLAHAHGVILALVVLAVAKASPLSDADAAAARAARRTAGLVRAGALLVPAGFALGGIAPHEGDPGWPVVLVPLGGLLLVVGPHPAGLAELAVSLAAQALRFPTRPRMFYDRAFVGDGRGLSAQIWQVRPAQADGAGRDGRDLSGGRGRRRRSRSSASSRRSSRRRSDRAKANRFLDEAKVVLRLTHANLVPTFDAGEIDGEFYIAMDLIEGKDLREIWNRCVRTRTRIPLDVALHVGREVARALSYVHGYGDLNLVHRDVAPPNILLSYFGEVKLTDFGLARSVLKKEHTAPGVVFGRASYLAPEQARGEVADARTDVYSLGIVLWELLTGNQYLQLANLDPTTAMSLVRHPRPQTPSAKAPWITPALDKLLMRALAPAREDRYQSAEELRQALADVMAEVAPRADTERVASFVKGLYEDAIREERMEREKLVVASRALPALRAGRRRPRDVVELEMPAVARGARAGHIAGRARSRQGAGRPARRPGRWSPGWRSRAKKNRWASTSSAA